MTDPVRHHAQARPDAPAVVLPDAVWTWRDLDARVGAAARRLAAFATPHPVLGPTVAVVARTQPDLVALVLGALRAGIVVAPLPARWPPAAVADALTRLGLTHVVTDDHELADVTTHTLADLVAPDGEAGPAPDLDPARLFTVVHTSGTTGAPRPAVHTVGNHVASAAAMNAHLALDEDGRWLLDLPLAHVGGLGVIVRCALAGAAVAIPAPGVPTADALRTLAPTHASMVSTQLVRLLRDAAPPPPGLRAILLGGSAIAPGLLDRASAAGWPVATSYGLTEMTSTVTATPPGADRAALATSGLALPGREVRIGDGDEILVRGATLFAGYVTHDRLGRPLDADRWYATGDLGRLDDGGRLTVVGRIGNQFVSGGENVQPEAIEAALAALAGVAEAVVVAVPDAEWGARAVAWVRPTADALPAADVLADGLRRTLPGYAIPVTFHAWVGADGMKPDRRALAAEAARREAG